ncbi:Gfo/Idh/MocA family oxidoreductase [Pseudarthrobacter equi]|uniref:Gfo/Idh/MocA family protein n=1 Tax=Pseudarthrobacter TaxID=1742993 RepID=UPI001584BCC2|nr:MULTISPECIES: Gfo/Idh/MocA family oxidoreductase [Pseudarthrobacter]MCT9625995.1 Gfo/Idh/MocA family oxidoreductase [Pseudarthrobacter equi]NUT72152.1 Gfo/Idh/MocA family oxidoreductase [Pseudarthrobacter sp. C4D7]
MRTFATQSDPTSPIRVVLIGAGLMGKKWISALTANPDVELVGLVDLNLAAAEAALSEAGLTNVTTGTNLTQVATSTGAQAVVNVTIPAAHLPTNMEALFNGLPVLCEKPVAPTVSQGLSLVAAAEATGQLLMISQSRRYYRTLARLKNELPSLGDIGIVTTEFFKAPHFGGFREEMDHVLLVDMAIHAFDVARYLLDQEPVSVYCEEYNPNWSWYKGDAATSAIFELSGGARYIFTGSWCSPGLETSWNGNWRISGANGTATWDGEKDAVFDIESSGEDPTPTNATDIPEEIAGSLAEFVQALRTGTEPSGEVHGNVLSLAMVEAAVLSAEQKARVSIEHVLSAAHATAQAEETRPEVKEILASWSEVSQALSGHALLK